MRDLDGKRCSIRVDSSWTVFGLFDQDGEEVESGGNPRRLSEDALDRGASEVRWTGEACQIAFVLGLL